MVSAILSICGSVYGAVEDTEYPDVILLGRAAAGVGFGGVDRLGTVEGVMTQSLRELVGLGAMVVVNACNTTGDSFVRCGAALSRVLGVRVIDTLETTVGAIDVESRVVGILSSRALRDSRAYVLEVERSYRGCVVLDDYHQGVLDDVIHQLMGGRFGGVTGGLERVLSYLVDQGADHVVAGCTELSSVSLPGLCSVGVTDSVAAVAEEAARWAYAAAEWQQGL
jgi:aspartate/glutamate racemase